MDTPDLLATIVAAARRITEVRQAHVPVASLERRLTRRPGGDAFVSALAGSPEPRIIAECKRRSPSKGILRQAYDPAVHARAYEDAGAAAISVLTEPTFFDGAPHHLHEVRQAVSLPLLRKDFIVSRYQLLEAAVLGADATLLIVAAMTDRELQSLLTDAREIGLAAVVEVHTRDELRRALDAGAPIVGVNSRNLRTLAVDATVPEELAPAIPGNVVAVAESGISSGEEITRLAGCGFRAFLVGERLIRSPNPGAALRELRGMGVCG